MTASAIRHVTQTAQQTNIDLTSCNETQLVLEI